MPFQIDEKSVITIKKGDLPETQHREITDAMQNAVNWLASQQVGTKVIIIEKTTVTKTSQ